MRITASAISLNLDDVDASATFVKRYFGFTEDMAADGFVSLSRDDAGFNLIRAVSDDSLDGRVVVNREAF